MKNVMRLALVDPNDSSRNSLKTLLLGIDVVWLEAECSRYEFFGDVARQTNPNIALISLDSNPSKGLELVAQISRELPECSVLVVSSSQEGSVILQAMRNGAKEFLGFPLRLDDFLAALDRIRASAGGTTGTSKVRASKVIAVTGVSGGVGCTSLAINLGCCLAQDESRSVAVIDLDLALGDADVWLDIIPDYTIQDVAENITRLDYTLLKRSLTQHECGVFLLPRPVHMDDRPLISPDELKRVISLLKTTFSHLVIDLSKGYSPLDLAAMEAANEVFLVTQLDLPCLRNAVRIQQFFEERESYADKLKLVINRLGLEDNQISVTKALNTLGREVFWQLPNEYGTMVEARNNGVPLIKQAPRSKLTKSFIQLAEAIDGTQGDEVEEKQEEKKLKKRLFNFLGSGKDK